jgi:hypothetical protein
MLEIQEDYREEYQNLTKDERDELVKNFKEEKSTLRKIPRPTARGVFKMSRMLHATSVSW